MSKMSVEARLEKWFMPEPNSGCHLWLGTLSGGYGRLTVARKSKLSHRLAWECANGPVPPGLKVLHRCDNPACVNPEHLFLGTDADNVRDMIQKGRKAIAFGERTASAKLTAEQVMAIRRDSRAHRVVAQEFGVSKSLVGAIRRREGWRHIGV